MTPAPGKPTNGKPTNGKPTNGEPTIRDSAAGDIAAILAIYAHHVAHGVASFEVAPPDIAEMTRRRDAVLAAGLPYLVAEAGGGVAGFACAGPTVAGRPTATPSRPRFTSPRMRLAGASAAPCWGR